MGKAKLFLCVASAAFLCSIGASSASPNLLTNGSFETGNFDGWTLSGNTGYTGVIGCSSYCPEDGNYQGFFGAVGSLGYISQSFSDAVGTTYTVSLWEASDGGTPSEFDVAINGTDYIDINPVPAAGYVQYTFTFTGSGTDTLSISNQNDPAYQYVDNVYVGVGPQTAVPEPSTWAMMLLGFAGLGFAGYRSRRASLGALA